MTRTKVSLLCLLFFALGVGAGFLGGVLSVKSARNFLSTWLEDEKPADVANAQSLRRSAFSFQYPGNWKLMSDDSDYDPDHMFSIDTPGSSLVMFVIADANLDLQESVDTYVQEQTTKVMKDASRSNFDSWGSYRGVGAQLRGRMLGVTPGTIRVFAWKVTGRTFTVLESTYDDDRGSVSPGFALIERTFRVDGQM